MNGPLISLLQAEQLSVALILVCNIYTRPTGGLKEDVTVLVKSAMPVAFFSWQ